MHGHQNQYSEAGATAHGHRQTPITNPTCDYFNFGQANRRKEVKRNAKRNHLLEELRMTRRNGNCAIDSTHCTTGTSTCLRLPRTMSLNGLTGSQSPQPLPITVMRMMKIQQPNRVTARKQPRTRSRNLPMGQSIVLDLDLYVLDAALHVALIDLGARLGILHGSATRN
jgi:hypothetical protein